MELFQVLCHTSHVALNKHTHAHPRATFPANRVPSILYALLDVYCLLIFSGKTMPWYLSMAMQVIVRIPVTIAVVCTKGTVLHTRTPIERNEQMNLNNRHCTNGNSIQVYNNLQTLEGWDTMSFSPLLLFMFYLPSKSCDVKKTKKKQSGY